MIKTWRNRVSRRIFDEGGALKRFGSLDIELAELCLEHLHATTSLGDLYGIRSLQLHKLKGTRKDQWAIKINGPWRVCFRFEGGDAFDVEVVDYH